MIREYLSQKISYVRALYWIVGSLFITAIVGYKGIDYWLHGPERTIGHIAYIVHTAPQRELLRSDYLAELAGLSLDAPVEFSKVDIDKIRRDVIASPLISTVDVKKIAPDMVYMDYILRKPFVCASDFVNAAWDRNGVLVPIHPFFSPKKMTHVYLGEEGSGGKNALFGFQANSAYFDLACVLIEQLSQKGQDCFFVRRVDVSRAYEKSLGKREIVVVIDHEDSFGSNICFSHFLRLTPKQFSQEIDRYLQLREHLVDVQREEISLNTNKGVQSKVVDLRLPQLAYIDSMAAE